MTDLSKFLWGEVTSCDGSANGGVVWMETGSGVTGGTNEMVVKLG